MPKTAIHSVDAYGATKSPVARRALETLRATLRKALPDAEETISYRIPACRLNGRILIWFAVWARHAAVYPVHKHLLGTFRGKMPVCELRGSTLRLPLAEPIAVKLVAHIAQEIAKSAAEKRTRIASPRKRKIPAAKRRAKGNERRYGSTRASA